MENAQPEPSMEEILASIRRIISEDEEDAAPPAAPASATSETSPKASETAVRADTKPAAAPESSNITQLMPADEDGANPHLETEDVEMIKKNVAAVADDDAMLDQVSAAAASSAFETLSQSVRISDGPGRTLEDLVIDMLKPMVKEWLDANLPAIVEEKVEEEVQRVARRRR